MLDLTLLILLIVAGRIMPFFTQSALPGSQPVNRPWVEGASFAVATALALLNLLTPVPAFAAIPLLALAALQAIRLAGWYDGRAWRNPMLAVLYAGYLWMIAGLALDGLSALRAPAPFPALHALTTGAIGVFTFGMVTRVTLGHTGRDMRASPATIAAFLTINLAALTRVVPALLWPSQYSLWLGLSGGLLDPGLRDFPLGLRPHADGPAGGWTAGLGALSLPALGLAGPRSFICGTRGDGNT